MRVERVPFRLISAATAAVFLAACGPKQSAPPKQTPEVGVVTVQPTAVPVVTELPGRTSAFLVAEVRARVDGIVLRREFTEGSEVKAGQRLYKIDPAPFIAALNNAKAALAKAQANLASTTAQANRFKVLVAANAVSKQDYDNAVEASQATLLSTVQQLDPVYVDLTQSSLEGLKLRREIQEGRVKTSGINAAKVTLILEDGHAYSETGKLQFADVTVDQTTGSVTIRAIFQNKDRVLLPGMFVRARIEEGVNEKALLVPQVGITHDQKGQPTALVVGQDNKVALRTLIASQTYGSSWVVESGLNPGDRVIVQGTEKVRPGAEVKPVAAQLPAPASGAAAQGAPAASGTPAASGAQTAQSASAASGAQ